MFHLSSCTLSKSPSELGSRWQKILRVLYYSKSLIYNALKCLSISTVTDQNKHTKTALLMSKFWNDTWRNILRRREIDFFSRPVKRPISGFCEHSYVEHGTHLSAEESLWKARRRSHTLKFVSIPVFYIKSKTSDTKKLFCLFNCLLNLVCNPR